MTSVVDCALELKGIDKKFGAVHANKNINLQVRKGSVHGIVGENGAGKSTLMSIIYGFYQADQGDILIDGKTMNIKNSQQAIDAGIGMVHQHFMLVNNFTVLENIMLGAEGGSLLARGMSAARKQLKTIEQDYGLEVDLDAVVGDLPVGIQQRVEILKALYRGAKILILDEPTGVLTPQETDHLFKILNALKEQGTTIILITHKLREIMAVTNQVSVMRQGEMVAHVQTQDTDKEQLAELMVGRKVRLEVEKTNTSANEPGLEVKGLNYVDAMGVSRLTDVSFTVNKGEIVGIAGVSGNGQSELLAVLSGMDDFNSGELVVNGQTIQPGSGNNAESFRHMGVGHVPEDRHKLGLVNQFAAKEAYILGHHKADQYNGTFLQNKKNILQDCVEKMQNWDVRPPNPELKTASFSGGNQQKLVIAREVEKDPSLFLVGQPTRGVDIGAIEFIHQRITDMRNQGKAVLLVSVELDEIMTLADRILVMFDGKIVGQLNADQADEKTLGLMMANSHNDGEATA